MRFWQRRSYYFRRLKEAPLSFLIKKLSLEIKKSIYKYYYQYLACYFDNAARKSRRSAEENFRALGNDIRLSILKLSDENPDFRYRCLRRAKNFLNDGFHCLGFGRVYVDKKLDWQSDVFHQYVWPKHYFNNIDFVKIDSRCDVKVPWEISRFQYLLWLAEAYILDPANKELYIGKYTEIVEHWLDENAPGFGVNWTVGMEVAIRACNLALASAVFHEDLSSSLKIRVFDSLNHHKLYLKRFPEFSDVSGNHFLANLMGLAILYVVFEGSDNDQVIGVLDRFFDEADRQFEEEGCHFERAPMYHRLCMDMVGLVAVFALRFGHSETLARSILKRAMAFCEAVARYSGRLPVIGDNDSGHILWFGGDARCFSSIECVHNLIEKKCLVEGVQLESSFAWHLGIAGGARASFACDSSVPSCTNSKPSVFEGGGVVSIEAGGLLCTMRVGEQGLLGRASHDHDDALSVWLTFWGRDIIVEEGCHSYTLDRDIRARYIASNAHNVIQPVGRSRYKGKEGSIVLTAVGAPTASCYHTSASSKGCSVEAQLNPSGANQLHFDSCQRSVRLVGGSRRRMIVEDAWKWTRIDAPEIRWHFAPGLVLQQCTTKSRILIIDSQNGTSIGSFLYPIRDIETVDIFEYPYSEKYGSAEICQGIKIVALKGDGGKFVSQFEFFNIESD